MTSELFYKLKTITQMNLQSMEKNLDILLKQEALLQEQKKEKQAVILQLNKDIEEQKPKLERVIKQVCMSITDDFELDSDKQQYG